MRALKRLLQPYVTGLTWAGQQNVVAGRRREGIYGSLLAGVRRGVAGIVGMLRCDSCGYYGQQQRWEGRQLVVGGSSLPRASGGCGGVVVALETWMAW